MKKVELIQKVKAEAGISTDQAQRAVEAVVGALIEVGRDEGSLSLQGLGTFKGKMRPARTARNPATGEQVEVAAKRQLTFKQSAGLILD